MKIKISDGKVAEINEAFSAIKGKAVTHTASHHEIFELAAAMEAKLESLGIPKKDRAGATATGCSGGNVPSAYKWTRTVTRYKIERKSSDWFLVDAARIDIYGNASAQRLSVTQKQNVIALAKFSQQFAVQDI